MVRTRGLVDAGSAASTAVTRRRRRRAVVAVTALAVALAGCAAPEDEPEPSGSITPAPDETDDVVVDLPDHAAGRQAAWVLDQVNAPAGTSVEDWDDRASAPMVAALPVAQLESVLDQVRALGPWTVRSVEGDERALAAHITGSTEQAFLLQVAVDAVGRIEGLFFAEPPPERDAATSLEDLADEVGAMTARTSLLVARVEDGRCVPVEPTPAGTGPAEALPVGSIVKLWVLGAVVDAVDRGDLAWSDELTVTDDLRSLPSGELQDAPAGTTVTVEEAARGMIAISDNTATDLLVDAVGRDAVVDAMAAAGHHDPALNDPLPTTRDLFRVGWGGGAELRERWRDGDAAERAAILAEDRGGALDVDPGGMTDAVWAHGVDWFATAADVCAAHVRLAQRADEPGGAVVDEILSANPGVGAEAAGAWDHVAFKGGSSVGTMAGSWYVEDADGRAYAVVLLTAARTAALGVGAPTMVGIAEDALRLVAEQRG